MQSGWDGVSESRDQTAPELSFIIVATVTVMTRHRGQRRGRRGEEARQMAFAEAFEQLPEVGHEQRSHQSVDSHAEHYGRAERHTARRTRTAVANNIGITPNTNASAVIIIGRNLTRPARMALERISIPERR